MKGRVDPRRAAEESTELRGVATGVQEDVGKRVADFPGRPEHVEVVAVREHGAAAGEDAVRRARQARGDRLHSGSEIRRARGLDDCVHVVALDRVMRNPEPAPFAGLAPAPLELAHESRGAEGRDVAAHLQGDVAREAWG